MPESKSSRRKRAPLPVLLFWKAHRWIYRASGGAIGKDIGTAKNLLLTTTGRKSGRPRDIAIYYFEVEGKIVIIASNIGRDHHPAWYLNLKANPEVKIQIGADVSSRIAREAEGAERERLWQAVVSREADYAQTEKRTERRIPVIVLEPE